MASGKPRREAPAGNARRAPHRGAAAFRPAPAFRPTLSTARLVLRPLRPGDAGRVAAVIGDPAVSRNLARVPHPYSQADAEGYVAFAARAAAARRSLILAITRRDAVIGVVSIDAVPARNRLGYWLARSHWGHGYASEAVGAAVAYAIDVLGARLVRAGVFYDNPASLKVVRRLGFRAVGRRAGRSAARDTLVDFAATVLPRRRFLARRTQR